VPPDQVSATLKASLLTALEKLKAAAEAGETRADPQTIQEIELRRLELLAHSACASRRRVYATLRGRPASSLRTVQGRTPGSGVSCRPYPSSDRRCRKTPDHRAPRRRGFFEAGKRASEDPLDAATAGSAAKAQPGPYTQYLKADALKGKRFGNQRPLNPSGIKLS
jgi:hypothetical protein